MAWRFSEKVIIENGQFLELHVPFCTSFYNRWETLPSNGLIVLHPLVHTVRHCPQDARTGARSLSLSLSHVGFWDTVCPWSSVNDSEDHGVPREAVKLRESSSRGLEVSICCSGFQTLVCRRTTERNCLNSGCWAPHREFLIP